MPKNVAKADSRFKAAAGFIRNHPTMPLPQAMKLADFSVEEQACHAKRMVLHHLLNKTKGNNVTPPPLVINVSSHATGVSSVSNTTCTFAVEEAVVPKVKRIRLSTRASQILRAGSLQQKTKYNQAFKRATVMYAREREKDDGMSARAVVDTIEKDTGVILCVRTIPKKVSAGNTGTTPLRRGPKGHIPDCSYCAL